MKYELHVVSLLIADGFARSEAVAAILIQRKDNAKRNYATILNIRSNSDGYKHEGLMCPSGRVQEMLFRETYEQAGVDPGHVSYIDAHGTGTVLGDPQELQSISNVFCKTESRKKPLQVGSVKTNMGHSESAAGLCSVAKTIVAIQTGVIPRSLHFNKPKPEQEKLFDGTLEVSKGSVLKRLQNLFLTARVIFVDRHRNYSVRSRSDWHKLLWNRWYQHSLDHGTRRRSTGHQKY